MSIFTSVWRYLSVAKLPRVALSFTDNSLVIVELRKRRGEFQIERSASIPLPKSLINPDFLQANITDPTTLSQLIRQVAEQAGLKRESRWSVALPEGVARTMVVTLENTPESPDELTEMINWRLERILSVDPARLRIVRQSLSEEGQQKYLVTAVEENVISEYENVFHQTGWYAGMLMPRHLCEAILLGRDRSPADKLLISHNPDGMVSFFIRGEKPIMVRVHNATIEERENELFRLATYYRDRFMQSLEVPLKVLAIGNSQEVEITEQTLADALHDFKFSMVNLSQLGVKIPEARVEPTQLAAATGLALLGYN